jgi:hypothetical protein
MTDLFIRRVYEHKGIKVAVDIDLVKREISLVEQPNKNSQWSKKKWIFAERGIEYMNGWLLILDAMKFAITEAKKELEAAKDRDDEAFVNMLVSLNDNLKGEK